MSNQIDLELAREAEPEGKVCHFCSKENDFADDCGFFYILDPSEAQVRKENGTLTNEVYPACESCYYQHRHYHFSIYGWPTMR